MSWCRGGTGMTTVRFFCGRTMSRRVGGIRIGITVDGCVLVGKGNITGCCFVTCCFVGSGVMIGSTLCG